MLGNTYTHVQGDGNEHRLAEEDLEGTRECLLNTLPYRELLPLKGCPPAVVASLFPQLLSTTDEKGRTKGNVL